MKFKEIDPLLNNWAQEKKLFVNNEYKDDEVRSLLIVDDSGETYQIYIEMDYSNQNPLVIIATDNKKNKSETKVLKETFTDGLNKSLLNIEEWIKKKGNTRTVSL